jgi:hypothetical protein
MHPSRRHAVGWRRLRNCEYPIASEGDAASRSDANNVKRLTRYGRASFAGTVAEYVHCLWHEVTVRTGPDYLPVPPLRRRLELLARWFPPNRGYRLFPAALCRAGPSPSPRAC